MICILIWSNALPSKNHSSADTRIRISVWVLSNIRESPKSHKWVYFLLIREIARTHVQALVRVCRTLVKIVYWWILFSKMKSTVLRKSLNVCINIKYESFCLLCIIIQIWNRNNNLYKYKLDQAFVFSFLKNSILVQRKGLLRNQNICRLPVEIKAVKIKYASCQNENRNNCFSRSNLPVILITKIRIPAGMHTSMSVTEKATNIRILPTTCKLSLTPL